MSLSTSGDIELVALLANGSFQLVVIQLGGVATWRICKLVLCHWSSYVEKSPITVDRIEENMMAFCSRKGYLESFYVYGFAICVFLIVYGRVYV